MAGPGKAGPRERYTPGMMIAALQQARGLTTVTADVLRCSPRTVEAYCRRYPAVAAARQDQRERVTDLAEVALFKAISEGQAWAVCFYLKTQGKSRGYVERHELTGRDGDPVRLSWADAVEAAWEQRRREPPAEPAVVTEPPTGNGRYRPPDDDPQG